MGNLIACSSKNFPIYHFLQFIKHYEKKRKTILAFPLRLFLPLNGDLQVMKMNNISRNTT